MLRHISLPVALLLSTFATTTVSFHLQPLPLHKLITSATTARTTTAKQRVRCLSSSSLSPLRSQSRLYFTSTTSHAFLASDVDSVNTPPSLSIILKSLDGLANGSDIRGKFVDHPRVGNFAAVAQAITASNFDNSNNKAAPLTPLAAYCLGYGFAEMMKQQQQFQQKTTNNHLNDKEHGRDNTIRICIGTDPRSHGPRLADAFSRGCSSCSDSATSTTSNVSNKNNKNYKIEVVYTGIATTPSMMDFCRTDLCDAAVMLTASHLPVDRNGMKFFVAGQGGFTKTDVQELISLAKEHANSLLQQSSGMIPPSSGEGGVFCAQHVDYMPIYASNLSKAIQKETSSTDKPLEGLKIVLNSGNGSGGFFHDVLRDLGADMSASIGVEHDSAFLRGVPNPESKAMVDDTIRLCQESKADLGIMLDTDADRSGFIVPGGNNKEHENYEPLHRNRLIALLGVIFSKASPGCTFVTDSVTSEGLQDFLEGHLGLTHVRYLKGYANVISKAKEITESGTANAEVAIETSGHCAMRENDYLDDGTYTAVKVLGLLAKVKQQRHEQSEDHTNIGRGGGDLLQLIAELKEMPETQEFRLAVMDGTLGTTSTVFEQVIQTVESSCELQQTWTVDTANLEGLRIRTSTTTDNNVKVNNGGFFMLRKSLHDPLVSMQVEGESASQIRDTVVRPLLQLLQSDERIANSLDLSVLSRY